MEAKRRKDSSAPDDLRPASVWDCLDDTEIESFVLRRLSGAALDRVEQHLLFCRPCQERVKAEEEFINMLRTASQPPEDADEDPVP